jgi:hypothetical protein
MSDLQEEIAHLKEVRRILTERRRWLEQQLAHHGFASSPVQLLMDFERTKNEINEVDLKLVQLGEISHGPSGLNLLERIASLEGEVAELRSQLVSISPRQPDFSWHLGWFAVNDDHVMIHGRMYLFSDIVQYDEDYFNVNQYGGIRKLISERVIVSPDRSSVALLMGEFYIAMMHLLVYEDRNLWAKRRLSVFSFEVDHPVFTSKDDHYVYSGPAYSSDGRYIAFAYAHDLRLSKFHSDSEDSTTELETVNWDETVAVLDTHNWEAKELFTKRNMKGFGEWSTPENFFDLTFIHHDAMLFASRGNDWGVVNIWNIPIDGSEPKIIYNPAWKERGGDA